MVTQKDTNTLTVLDWLELVSGHSYVYQR